MEHREECHYQCRESCRSSVVLVEETTGPVAAVDSGTGLLRRWLAGVWWLEPERAVRPLAVVVIDVDAEELFELAAVGDQEPVEALRADGSDAALGDRVRTGGRVSSRSGLARCERPSRTDRSTLSPGCGSRLGSPVKLRFRACWVTQPPLTLVVELASQTLRLECSMKNDTLQRRRKSVSTVRKSQATMLAASRSAPSVAEKAPNARADAGYSSALPGGSSLASSFLIRR